ncbi:hypothetical protein [Natronoglycomyces albus]|uniref:Uncharacterized protein n=1 Tax=Natronoglycomyces albus TaxID=2811108 RepID=A0A895XGY4_9ACTN|nr:hypothetical protein [Natronoglycomyces albus]QSB04167.1 hypothetical protein JQS30_10115 [Natronoglycomyces albus]
MQMIVCLLKGAFQDLEPDCIKRSVLSAQSPQDLVEHVYVRVSERVEVVVYTGVEGHQEAQVRIEQLIRRAVAPLDDYTCWALEM